MDGLGVLIYPYGEKSIVGEWKEGKEWNTKHRKKDGTLLGKFENGEWILRWGELYEVWTKKGGFYITIWEEKTKLNEKDSKKYEGEIKNGVPNGQGKTTYPDGRKYEGEWKNGEPNGQGTFTKPDGGKYVGEFKDGKWNGQGTYTSPDGRKYVGDWKDGRTWNGTEYDKNGNINRKFVNGKKIKQ